jgi:hypothetical protein
MRCCGFFPEGPLGCHHQRLGRREQNSIDGRCHVACDGVTLVRLTCGTPTKLQLNGGCCIASADLDGFVGQDQLFFLIASE